MATLVREVKHRSSQWIHEEIGQRDFAWQTGYGIFSVSKSMSERVTHYIENQETHHRTRDFRSELIGLLTAHGVEFGKRYLH